MYVFMASDNTQTLITHGRTRLNKTLFLRKFHDQYRTRQVVDQCSLWKERPQMRLQKQLYGISIFLYLQ